MENTSFLIRNLSLLFEKVKEENVDQKEMQFLLQELEKTFLKAAEEEGYIPNRKDDMFKILEEQSKERLKELEEKINKKDSVSFVQEQAASLHQKIQDFWREEGFHYVDNVKTDYSGIIEVKFGFSLHNIMMLSDKKVTGAMKQKTQKEELLKQGYLLDPKQKFILDRDSNKEKIKELILNRFPSSYIVSWKSHMFSGNDARIDRLTIRIREPKDV